VLLVDQIDYASSEFHEDVSISNLKHVVLRIIQQLFEVIANSFVKTRAFTYSFFSTDF